MTELGLAGPNRPVIIPLSSPAELARAGPHGARISAAFNAPLELVCIVGERGETGVELDHLDDAVRQYASDSAVPVVLRVVVTEDPSTAFLEICSGSFVCMATSASPFRDGHYVGSFAAALLAGSAAPVLLVGPSVVDDPGAPRWTEVVAAVSESDQSEKFLGVAREFAAALGLTFSRVHIDESGVVYTNRYLEPSDRLASSLGASMVDEIEHTRIDDTILARHPGVVLAVATHARQGLSWIAEGSVSFDLISDSTAPVLAIGPKFGSSHVPARTPDSARSPHVDGPVVELAEVDDGRPLSAHLRDELDARGLTIADVGEVRVQLRV